MSATANAARTARRIANLHRMVAELQCRDMARDDIMDLLEVSITAVRLLVLDLGELVESTRAGLFDQYHYHLRATPDEVCAFLAAFGKCIPAHRIAHNQRRTPRTPRTPKEKLLAGPSRRFHTLEDDAVFSVRVHHGPAAPDPFALPVAFFRPAQVRA